MISYICLKERKWRSDRRFEGERERESFLSFNSFSLFYPYSFTIRREKIGNVFIFFFYFCFENDEIYLKTIYHGCK